VPGQKYDLFFSYAHADDSAWIEAFRRSLASVWMSGWAPGSRYGRTRGICAWDRTGKSILRRAINGAAAFLALCSPSYFNSRWCSKERKAFLSHHQAEDRSKPFA